MVKRDLSQIKKIIEDYVCILEERGIKTEQVILYGSYASGTARPESDIDIVVVASDLAKWPFLERLQMLSKATLTLHAPMEVLGYTPDEIRNHSDESILWEEVSRTGKEIFHRAA